jgi:hypothetical protein
VVSVIEYCSKTRELLPFVWIFDNKNEFFANPSYQLEPGCDYPRLAVAGEDPPVTVIPFQGMQAGPKSS